MEKQNNTQGWIIVGLFAAGIMFMCSGGDKSEKATDKPAGPTPQEIRQAANEMAIQAQKRALEDLWNWRDKEHTDEFDGRYMRQSVISSSSRVFFEAPYAGGSTLTILFEKIKGKVLGNIVIDKGQFTCSSYSGCKVQVKVGDGKIRTFNASTPDSYDPKTLVIPNAAPLFAMIKGSSEFMVRVSFYQYGQQAFTFTPNNTPDL